MKDSRLPTHLFYMVAFVLATVFSSCSGQKQVFYFQPAPTSPKSGTKTQPQAPVYTASMDLAAADILPTVPDEIKTVAISKKELRKLLQQQVRLLKDTIPNKQGNRRVQVSGDKQKLKELKSDVNDFKNSVRVEENEDKVVVNFAQPETDLSDTAKILLAVGALIILIALFSIPVIGPLLAAILAVAVVAGALALILGYVEINRN